jgi:hypothetical protein
LLTHHLLLLLLLQLVLLELLHQQVLLFSCHLLPITLTSHSLVRVWRCSHSVLGRPLVVGIRLSLGSQLLLGYFLTRLSKLLLVLDDSSAFYYVLGVRHLLLLLLIVTLRLSSTKPFIVGVSHLYVEFGQVFALFQGRVIIIILLLLLLFLHDIALTQLALVVGIVDHSLFIVTTLSHL